MIPNIDQYINFDFDKGLSRINCNENINNSISVEKIIFLPNQEKELVQFAVLCTQFDFNLVRNRFSDKENVIIICSKDNGQVLDHSIHKLLSCDVDADILLVDDRSESDQIFRISEKFNTSYLRINNNNNVFNYSMINNIAVCYAKHNNKKLSIFYNNDLWPAEKHSLTSLIKKHKDINSDLTGCRLVYPTANDYLSIGKPQHILNNNIEKVYNTIQHGGIHFGPRISYFMDNAREKQFMLCPSHSWRFSRHDHPIASSDSRCCAVTGALHIINIDTFMSLGGLNPSMSTTFQDIDLCMRAIKRDMSVNYIGSEYMYHAESLTIVKNNYHQTRQFTSDNILWDYLWGSEISNLIGYR